MVPSSARQDGSWRPPFIRETGRASPCSSGRALETHSTFLRVGSSLWYAAES
ncbi:MAG: hypothetical protein E6H45_06875 [Betaproteobacteria bacterium]|nr:MAG: hypothetical protein E6H45_06875 [Betaproteobacteria bacterium]